MLHTNTIYKNQEVKYDTEKNKHKNSEHNALYAGFHSKYAHDASDEHS